MAADSYFMKILKQARGGAFFRALLNPIKALQAAQAIDDALSTGIGQVPVGAIVAWHKNFSTQVPALPANFRECDGSVIGDTSSPLNGLTLPNLNGTAKAAGSQDGQFLRGYTAATPDTSAVQAQGTAKNGLSFTGSPLGTHSHTVDTGTSGALGSRATTTTGNVGTLAIGSTTAVSAGTPAGTISSTDAETRPTNFGVTWIMRIK